MLREDIAEGRTPYGYRVLIGSDLLPREASRVLDVGCGDGVLSRLCAFDGHTATIVGIDKKDVDLDTQPLPYHDGLFDAVICLDVVEHVLDPRRLLAEVCRVLHPDGVLILATPNIRWFGYLWAMLWQGRFPRTSYDPVGYDGGHLHYFTYSDVRALLLEAGFRGIEEFHFSQWNVHHTQWRARGRERLQYLLTSLLGRHLKLEFFSSSVVVRATK